MVTTSTLVTGASRYDPILYRGALGKPSGDPVNLVFLTALQGAGVEGVSIRLTLPVLLTALGMLGGLLLAAVKLSAVAQELRSSTEATNLLARENAKIVESLAESVVSLRVDRHIHKEKFMAVEEQIRGLESDMGDLWHKLGGARRRGDDE